MLLTIQDENQLFDHLSNLNDMGQIPERMIVFYTTGWPVPVYARLVSPSGDDVVLTYLRVDPDSGMEHCCECKQCDTTCSIRTPWSPPFPVKLWEPISQEQWDETDE